MVTAIVSSLLRSQFFQADQIICCSANDGTSEKLAEATKIHRSGSPDEVLDFNPDLLVLGCKPQQISTLSSDLEQPKSRIPRTFNYGWNSFGSTIFNFS